jgi:hypothetical protein
MASPKTPGEEEPVTQPYSGRGPLAVATLDGVIHLAHRGADDDAVMTETFSISGIMTPKLRVSYNSREDTTTSNGYGTLAEAGWSTQESIDGVSSAAGGAMAMTRLGDAMLLVFQPKEGGPVRLARGEYS